MVDCRAIYVVAQNGGCEGHSLPYLAFNSLIEAQLWARAQSDAYSVARVPIYPAFPEGPWHSTKAAASYAGTPATPPTEAGNG